MHFVDFVIKHMYKAKWDDAYAHNERFKELVTCLKSQAENVTDKYFTQTEHNLLYID